MALMLSKGNDGVNVRRLIPLLLLAVLVTFAATGCSHPESDRASTESTPPPALPTGVATDSGTTYSGIYAGGNEACCWLAGEARFEIKVPPNASKVSFTFFVPPNAGFDTQKESVKITVANFQPVEKGGLGPGVYTVDVPVDGAKAPQPYAPVVMHMSRAFSPKDLHLNDDGRVLSVALQTVRPN